MALRYQYYYVKIYAKHHWRYPNMTYGNQCKLETNLTVLSVLLIKL